MSGLIHPAAMAGVLCLMVGAVVAQEVPPPADPSADRATLEQKIAADPQLGSAYVRASQIVGRGVATVVEAREMLIGNLIGRNSELQAGQPFDYRSAHQGRLAEHRARVLSDVIRGDLNGDWQLSRDEIIWLGKQNDRGTMAATLLLTGDSDRDDVLSLAELTAAVEDMAAEQFSRDGRRDGSLEALFDFDEDGILTPQELDRGLAAMLLPLP